MFSSAKIGSPHATVPTSGISTVWGYLRYGAATTFASKKSKAVPVPERTTCAARDPWYDLTHVGRGFAFWPKATQYGHIVVANPDNLVCNCRVYYMKPVAGQQTPDLEALTAILNSTLVGLWKQFYGRPTGVEGAYDIMVADARIMEVPDPRLGSKELLFRLRKAWQILSSRDIGYFVEKDLLECRSVERARALAAGVRNLPEELQRGDRHELDDATLELIGVNEASERETILKALYEETAKYFRQIRVVEIEKIRQRAGAIEKRVSATDMAKDIYDALKENGEPLIDWLHKLKGGQTFNIPDAPPKLVAENDFFNANSVFFGSKGSAITIDCGNRRRGRSRSPWGSHRSDPRFHPRRALRRRAQGENAKTNPQRSGEKTKI